MVECWVNIWVGQLFFYRMLDLVKLVSRDMGVVTGLHPRRHMLDRMSKTYFLCHMLIPLLYRVTLSPKKLRVLRSLILKWLCSVVLMEWMMYKLFPTIIRSLVWISKIVKEVDDWCIKIEWVARHCLKHCDNRTLDNLVNHCHLTF